MKISKIIIGLLILAILSAVNSYAQEIALTTTEKNLTASKAIIEMPSLSGNQDAIITATPLGETAKLNPHPIGAWYYNGKWNIFNTDHANLPIGAKFKVQVFLKPDKNHFLHLVTRENLIGDSSYLNNPALNNNPKAVVAIFQNHAPETRSAALNKYEAKAEYDSSAGKWYIKNVNGERMFPDMAYNIVVSSGSQGTNGTTSSTSLSGVETYFKNASPGNTIPVGSLLIDGMTHDIVLAKKSRLIISGMLNSPAQLELWLKIDGSRVYIAKSATVISNFMIDLDPGNHTIEFWRFSYSPVNGNDLNGKSSSVIVIPLN